MHQIKHTNDHFSVKQKVLSSLKEDGQKRKMVIKIEFTSLALRLQNITLFLKVLKNRVFKKKVLTRSVQLSLLKSDKRYLTDLQPAQSLKN